MLYTLKLKLLCVFHDSCADARVVKSSLKTSKKS